MATLWNFTDTDARAVVVAWIVAFTGLVWFGWVNLQRIVRAAPNNRPFDPRNPVRLPCLAGIALAAPLLSGAMNGTIDRALDTDPPSHMATRGPGWWFSVAVGLGLLALAQVFAEGSRLRELEETTV